MGMNCEIIVLFGRENRYQGQNGVFDILGFYRNSQNSDITTLSHSLPPFFPAPSETFLVYKRVVIITTWPRNPSIFAPGGLTSPHHHNPTTSTSTLAASTKSTPTPSSSIPIP